MTYGKAGTSGFGGISRRIGHPIGKGTSGIPRVTVVENSIREDDDLGPYAGAVVVFLPKYGQAAKL